MRFQRGHLIVVGERVKYGCYYFPFIAKPFELVKTNKRAVHSEMQLL